MSDSRSKMLKNVENDDGIEPDNKQDCKWRGDDNEQVECFANVIVCSSGMLYFGKYHNFRGKGAELPLAYDNTPY